MKLSLAWLCDHLLLDYKSSKKVTLDQLNVTDLVNRLSQITAEIEQVHSVNFSLDNFSLMRVINSSHHATLKNIETNQILEMKMRPDISVDDLILVINEEEGPRYARLQDFGGTRSELFPSVYLTEKALATWRQYIETKDYILEIDNKSINHRPDLWGHRGFAREVGAIISAVLVPEFAVEESNSCKGVLEEMLIERFEKESSLDKEYFVSAEIRDFQACKRLAVLSISEIENVASHLYLASRLARIDARPIRTIVDITNYVMFDMGQPLHAFDADKIDTKKIIAQRASQNEKLTLLDDNVVELFPSDIVISDGNIPLALAGIMGGANSAVSEITKSIVLEAANFDAHTIRQTSQRVKKRTDASTRFEKSLDPNQNVLALQRAVKVLRDLGIQCKVAKSIISIGSFADPTTIKIAHEEIERKLGFQISKEFVINTLSKLGFGIGETDSIYRILVPTFRGTKDIEFKEDIIEEVGRFLLFHEKNFQLPSRLMAPFDTSVVQKKRRIKEIFAHTLFMHEVYNYNLFDAEFLRELSYTPSDAVKLKNPVSEHWQQLVTSLLPHLIKNVLENHTKYEVCRFFELANCWKLINNQVTEEKKLAGIFWHATELNFYEMKSLLIHFFHAIKLDVSWIKHKPQEPWWSHQMTAHLVHQGNSIGFAGIANKEFLAPVLSGQAFIFELDASFLLSNVSKTPNYKPASRFQPVYLDVSLFVPLEITVVKIEDTIAGSDQRIISTSLIDMYEKQEWVNKRSLTLRFVVQDNERTLTSDDIEMVLKKVHDNLAKIGGQVR